MRNIFVGALCALGVFLGAYDGYDEVDSPDYQHQLLALCAIGVAFCPTKLRHGLRGWCTSLPGIVGYAAVDQPAVGR